MSSPPNSSENLEPDQNPSTSSGEREPPQRTPSIVKLRKIPPIPVRKSLSRAESEEITYESSEDDGVNGDETESDPFMIQASALGLNHIRTRSAPSHALLRFLNSTSSKPSNLGGSDPNKGKDGFDYRSKAPLPPNSTEQGRSLYLAYT